MGVDIRSIESKYKKGNKLLFSRDSECLRDLIRLIEEQSHRTLVMWALDCAQIPLAVLEERCPDEQRPRRALTLCESWARGMVKMPQAKRAILDAHAAAKELDRVCGAYAHAIGHAGATVHVETHALGLVFYELTGMVYDACLDQCGQMIDERIEYYIVRLRHWREHTDTLDVAWAEFLLDDTRPNKEKVWNERRRNRLNGVVRQ